MKTGVSLIATIASFSTFVWPVYWYHYGYPYGYSYLDYGRITNIGTISGRTCAPESSEPAAIILRLL